jgi:hypothetical protein
MKGGNMGRAGCGRGQRGRWPRRLVRAALQLGLALSIASAGAQPATTWDRLTEAQRLALTPLQEQWAALPTPQQQKWLALADRLQDRPPAEQARIQDRLRDWAALDTQQRRQARRLFHDTRRWSARELHARWEAYNSLSPAEREALALVAAPAPQRAAAAAGGAAGPAGSRAGPGASTRTLALGGHSRPDPVTAPETDLPEEAEDSSNPPALASSEPATAD